MELSQVSLEDTEKKSAVLHMPVIDLPVAATGEEFQNITQQTQT